MRQKSLGNHTFWLVVLLIFSFFLSIIAYGGRKIYESEKQVLRQEAEEKIQVAEAILQAELVDLQEGLRFLGQQPVLARYLASGFANDVLRSEMEQFYRVSLLTHAPYRKIALVDQNGMERILVRRGPDGRPVIGPTGSRPDEYQHCLAKTAESATGEACVLSVAAGYGEGDSAVDPGLIISTALRDAAGNRQGILTISLDLTKIRDLLAPGMSIWTTDGALLIAHRRSEAEAPTAGLPFVGKRGSVPLSDTQVVHYRQTAFGPDQSLYVAFTQEMGRLKGLLFRITTVFLAILSVFFILLITIFILRARQFRELIEAQRAIVFSLANLAEWRDTNTGRHLERTRNLSVLLARQLAKSPKYRSQITKRFLADLYDAAPLHDLGKVGIPDSILLKPGALSSEEFRQMREHVRIGRSIIQGVIDKLPRPESFLLMSRNIAEFHHEKYDGKGYPEGRSGEEIPLEARIFALCDSYDAIRSVRPYKGTVTHLEAVARIYACRGTHFDPAVVDAFLDCEEKFVEIYEAHLLYDQVYSHLEGGHGHGFTERTALAWSDAFAVGVKVIDDQHRELISRINALYQHILCGRGKEDALRLVYFLKDYVIEHFTAEERYMLEHNYPDYQAHKEMHEHFIEDLQDIIRQINENGISSELVVAINRRVANWLVNHIVLIDKGLRQLAGGSDGA